MVGENIPQIPFEISEKPVTNIQEVPLREILMQHRRRYVLRLSVGAMVFRHIGRLERDEVHQRLVDEHPEYSDLREEFGQLYERSQHGGMGPEDMQRFRELDRALLPYSYRYSLPCIVSPEITTIEELDALLSMMKPHEADAVLELLATLNSPRDVTLSPDGVLLVQELKLSLPADLTIETVTAEQAQAFISGASELGKMAMSQMRGAIKNG